MDVAAILQALLGASAPTAVPGTASVGGAVETSFAALFAAAAGVERPAGAVALTSGDEAPAIEGPPADQTSPAADEEVLSLAGATVAAALVSPQPMPSSVAPEAPTPTASAVGDASPCAEQAPRVDWGAVVPAAVRTGPTIAPAAELPAGPSSAAAPDAATAVDASPPTAGPDGPSMTPEADVPAAGRAAPSSPRDPVATATPERAATSRRTATVKPAAETDPIQPEAKATGPAPEVAAQGGAAATEDQDGDAVAGTVEQAAPRRAADRPLPASVDGRGSVVHGPAPKSDPDVGGREAGHRGTERAVVVAVARRPGEVAEPKAGGNGADPSGPSSVSPTNLGREPAHAEATAPEPQAASVAAERDVERLLRLDQLRPVRVRDGGEMRLELAPEGLGRVEVRVAVRADAVHAALYAQQDQARDALVAHRPALEAALGRSHLRLETFSVGLGQHELGDPGRHTPHAEPAPEGAVVRRTTTPVPAPAPAAALEPAAPGGLSLRA